MWAAIVFTHHRGVRLAPGKEHPRGCLEGELVSYRLRQDALSAVSLKAGLNAPTDLAVLYRPRFVGFSSDVVRIAGLERLGEPACWVHQELICAPRERPADIPYEPRRTRRP